MWEYTCLTADERTWATAEAGVFERFMELRLSYVTAMGWLPGITSDLDRYDSDPATFHLVRMDDGDADPAARRVRAGMRLTRVGSLFESLTWSMLAANPSRQADIIAENFALIKEANALAANSGAGLWDITRLVAPTDGSLPSATVVRSIFELIGMAMYKTVVEPHATPTWVFLTTTVMRRLFDSAGIEVTVLWSGRVTPGDGYDCHLCLARPKDAYDGVVAARRPGSRRAHGQLLAGADALATRTVTVSV